MLAVILFLVVAGIAFAAIKYHGRLTAAEGELQALKAKFLQLEQKLRNKL